MKMTKKNCVETVDGGAMNDSSGSHRIEENENKRNRIVSTIATNRNTMKKTKKEEIGCS
jgi:hypothetical protein